MAKKANNQQSTTESPKAEGKKQRKSEADNPALPGFGQGRKKWKR